MEILQKAITFIGENIPSYVPLIICPAVLVLVAVLFTLFGGRKAYNPLAAAIGMLVFVLLCCRADVDLKTAFVFTGVFAAVAALLRLLFLCPTAIRKKSAEELKKRDEEIYEKFHEDVGYDDDEDFSYEAPSDEAIVDNNASLTNVVKLLAKLRGEKLSATDRLEADALSQTVNGFIGKTLTAKELHTLNDCLAAVLKLTAKYKI